MSGSDNLPELRARLRSSPRHDPERAQIHDFNNLLTEFTFAVESADKTLMDHFARELKRVYSEAVKA